MKFIIHKNKLICAVTSLFLIGSGVTIAGEKKSVTSLRGDGLMFTPNLGQVVNTKQEACPDILFKGSTGPMDVYLRKTGISYVVSTLSQVMHEADNKTEELKRKINLHQQVDPAEKNDLIFDIQRIDVDYINCNQSSETITGDQLEGFSNFYYSQCPHGITHVASYNTITQKNIYNLIDIKYYGKKEKGLEYDIVVNPGGDYKQIRLNYKGAKSVSLKNGKLYVATILGEMEEYIPKVYQEINGTIVPVAASYELQQNDATGTEISFRLASYRRDFPLIIDPFIYATYFGQYDDPNDLTTDATGNAYLVGNAFTNAIPTTPGVFQMNNNGGAYGDAFVAKFDPNGGLLWASFYGGSNSDCGLAIAVDGSGNVAISGTTLSADFPVSGGAYQPAYAGSGGGFFGASSGDAYVVKFNSSGTRQWGTFLGGTKDDYGFGIVFDAAGNIGVAGSTLSSDFPTQNAFQSVYGGSTFPIVQHGDAFLAKYDAGGTQLWSTYFGGSSDEDGYDVAVDAAGNFVITGGTMSTNIPTTPGSFQPTSTGADTYVAKFSSAGARLWATYYGGGNGGASRSIATDPSGNVIFTGITTSPTFQVTAGAFQTTYGGDPNGDGYVVKLDPNGNQLWATYHGSNGNTGDNISSVAVDKNGYIYILGEWEDMDNANFPMNTCALQKTFGGWEDWFVTKFNPAGKRICSTFIGGAGEEDLDIARGGLSVSGNYVYLTGSNLTGGFPITANAFQTSNTGGVTGRDAIVAKFCSNMCGDDVPFNAAIPAVPDVCKNTPVQFTVNFTSCDTENYHYQWTFPGGVPSASTLQMPSAVTFATPGTYTVSFVVTGPCQKDSVTQTINIGNLTSQITFSTNSTCYHSNNGTVVAAVSNVTGGSYTYSWSTGKTGTSNSTSVSITGLSPGTYSVNITDAVCSSSTSVTITEPPAIAITPGISTSASCANNDGTATVTASGGSGVLKYTWTPGLQTNTTATGLSAGIYTITVYDATKCSNTATMSVAANITVPVVTGNSTAINCTITSSTLTGTSAGNTMVWNGGSLTNASNPTTVSATGTYTVTATDAVSGCTATATVNVIANNTPPTVTANKSSDLSCTTTSATLTGTSAGNILVWNGGALTNAANPTTAAAAGTYTVTATDAANGCTNTATAVISSNTTLPTVTATKSSDLTCTTTSATLTGISVGNTLVWNGGSLTNAANPATTTAAATYTLTATDAINGCTNTATVIVSSNTTPPAVTATKSSDLTCITTSATLTGTSAGNTLVWNGGALTNAANPATVTVANTYTVTATDAANGCTNTATVIISSNTTPPTVTATKSSDLTCTTTFATLTGASAGNTLVWNGGSLTNATNPASVTAAATYTVTATDAASGCMNTATVIISSNTTPPTVTATTPAPLNCANPSTILSANSAGNTMVWNGGSLTNAPDPATVNAPGTYTVTAADASNGCTATATTQVTAGANFVTVTATATNLSCKNTSATLTGTSTVTTMAWNGGTLNNAANPATVTTAGTYTITVTDASSGCTNSATVIVTSNTTLPTVTATKSSDLNCTTTSATLTGTSAGNILVWNGGSLTNATNPATAVAAATYTVTATDAINGCTNTAAVIISSNITPPTVTATKSSDLTCTTTSATLTGTSAGNNLVWNGGSLTNASNPATANAAATYTVSATDASNGCTNTATVIVSLNNISPTVTAVNSNLSCNNTTAVLTATSAGNTMIWNGGSLNNAANPASVTVIGTYTVTATDATNGCTSTTSVTVSNPGAPTATLSQTDVTCFGGNDGTITATVNGGTAPYTYNWNNGQAAATATTIKAGSYNVTITDFSGCTLSLTTTISEPSQIKVSGQANQAICSGQSATISASASGGSGSYIFVWNNSTTASGLTVNPTATTIYTIVATDTKGCKANGADTVSVISGATAAFSGTDICLGLQTPFKDSSYASGGINFTKIWNFGDGTSSDSPVHTYTTAGTYNVTLTVSLGNCQSTVKHVVHVYPHPHADFSANPQPTTILNPVITLTDLSTGGTTGLWTLGDLTDTAYLPAVNIVHRYPNENITGGGNYRVLLEIENQFGCKDTISKIILIDPEFTFYAPNTFTPNGDGKNDLFYGVGAGIVEKEMWIFDRWGNQIFHTGDLNGGWDGKVQGGASNDVAQQDTYVWMVQLKEVFGKTRQFIGHVNLIR